MDYFLLAPNDEQRVLCHCDYCWNGYKVLPHSMLPYSYLFLFIVHTFLISECSCGC